MRSRGDAASSKSTRLSVTAAAAVRRGRRNTRARRRAAVPRALSPTICCLCWAHLIRYYLYSTHRAVAGAGRQHARQLFRRLRCTHDFSERDHAGAPPPLHMAVPLSTALFAAPFYRSQVVPRRLTAAVPVVGGVHKAAGGGDVRVRKGDDDGVSSPQHAGARHPAAARHEQRGAPGHAQAAADGIAPLQAVVAAAAGRCWGDQRGCWAAQAVPVLLLSVLLLLLWPAPRRLLGGQAHSAGSCCPIRRDQQVGWCVQALFVG